MNEVIYYHFKKNYIWLMLNILAIAALCSCLFCSLSYAYWWEFQVLLALLILSLLIWIYKYAAKQVMAVITDDTIKIDHNNPVAWKDIEVGEERMVKCCGKERRVIVLIPKKGIDYKYNFLQKHNGDFTPFCLPLYGLLTPEDEEKIFRIVANKVGLKAL